MKYVVKHVSRAALTFSLRVAIVLFGAGVGGWAVANESDPTPPVEAAKSNDDGKLICKQEPVMGSNIKKKNVPYAKAAGRTARSVEGHDGRHQSGPGPEQRFGRLILYS